MNPVQLEPFDELIRELRAQGLPGADSLAAIRTSAWSSSSEMIGELGKAVIRIQLENRRTSGELRRILGRCIEEARKVWPEIRLP
jgi:hypothetical protein